MVANNALNASLKIFEKFDVGVIHLDVDRKVVALNDFARKVLPVNDTQPFNKLVTSFHTEKAKPKVKFLLDEASGCPMANAVPMTMIINIPEQVLLIKVSRLGDEKGNLTGYVLIFYDVTGVVGEEDASSGKGDTKVRLSRIPMVVDQKVSFVDAKDVIYLESQAHYTRALTPNGFHFCNLSIGDLAIRLAPEQFMRVHRCFIVNLQAVQELVRLGSKTHLVMKGQNPDQIPVSRSEVVALRKALGLS